MSYKAELIRLSQNGYTWLSVFEDTIDELIYRTVESIEHTQPRNNAFLVQDNLNAASRSLERILSLRTAANNLEDKAVRQAIDYEQFETGADDLEELEKEGWKQTQKLAEKAGYEVSATTFSESSSDLAQGFRATMSANVNSLEAGIRGDDVRVELVSQKWQRIRERHKLLLERHQQPGHALNYEERCGRIRALIEIEVPIAFASAKAAGAGLSHVYGLSDSLQSFPKLDDDSESFLDRLVYWTREQQEELSLINQYESVFEHTISVAGPMVDSQRLVTETEFSTAMDSDGSISVNLRDYFPSELNRLRVIGVEVTLDHNHSPLVNNMIAHDHLYSRAIVIPPPQINPYDTSQESYIQPTPVISNNITTTTPNARIEFISTPTLENIDPKGEWTVKICDYVGYVDRTDRRRSAQIAIDIKLHLLLAATPERSKSSWGVFW